MAKTATKAADDANPLLGTAVSDGIFPAQAIRAMISAGSIRLAEPAGDGQLQPASIDLRLGPKAYRVRASFLPGPESKVADKLDDFKGLNERSPWFALMMLILMISMAGVPPTIGFYAKLSVLQSVVDANLVWLAVVAVVLSVIGAFYYIRIIKLMYFDKPGKDNTDQTLKSAANRANELGLTEAAVSPVRLKVDSRDA